MKIVRNKADYTVLELIGTSLNSIGYDYKISTIYFVALNGGRLYPRHGLHVLLQGTNLTYISSDENTFITIHNDHCNVRMLPTAVNKNDPSMMTIIVKYIDEVKLRIDQAEKRQSKRRKISIIIYITMVILVGVLWMLN